MPKNPKNAQKQLKKHIWSPIKEGKNKKDQFSLVSHNNNSSKGCLYKFWALWDFYTHFQAHFLNFIKKPKNGENSQKFAKIYKHSDFSTLKDIKKPQIGPLLVSCCSNTIKGCLCQFWDLQVFQTLILDQFNIQQKSHKNGKNAKNH